MHVVPSERMSDLEGLSKSIENQTAVYSADHLVTQSLYEQLLKDFEMAGIQLKPGAKSIAAVVEAVYKAIVELVHENSTEQLQNLLYRVDVQEMKLQRAIQQHVDAGYALTELVVKREFEKVIFKLQYAGRLESN